MRTVYRIDFPEPLRGLVDFVEDVFKADSRKERGGFVMFLMEDGEGIGIDIGKSFASDWGKDAVARMIVEGIRIKPDIRAVVTVNEAWMLEGISAEEAKNMEVKISENPNKIECIAISYEDREVLIVATSKIERHDKGRSLGPWEGMEIPQAEYREQAEKMGGHSRLMGFFARAEG